MNLHAGNTEKAWIPCPRARFTQYARLHRDQVAFTTKYHRTTLLHAGQGAQLGSPSPAAVVYWLYRT